MTNKKLLTPGKFNAFLDIEKEKFVSKLKYFYFEQNLSRDEVLKELKLTLPCVKYIMKKYGLK